MDQTRHDEMVGAVDALRTAGIKVFVADSFNYWSGSAPTGGAVVMDGVHPDDEATADILWGAVWDMVDDAVAAANILSAYGTVLVGNSVDAYSGQRPVQF